MSEIMTVGELRSAITNLDDDMSVSAFSGQSFRLDVYVQAGVLWFESF